MNVKQGIAAILLLAVRAGEFKRSHYLKLKTIQNGKKN